MNNALTSFALGQLQASEEYLVFTVDGEDRPTIVTPSELVVLYKDTKKELNYLKSELEIGKVDKTTESKKRLQEKQSMEVVSPQEECGTERTGPNNKKKVTKRSKSAPQKDKQ